MYIEVAYEVTCGSATWQMKVKLDRNDQMDV